MIVMVMMMKVIMLVFNTSVCRKVTPTQHTECPNTLFCLSSILPVSPHRSRGRTTMRTMTKWRRSRKHPRKIHVTFSCTMMLHVFFSFHRLHFNFISTSNFQSYGRPRNARPGRVGDGEGIQCFPFLARKRNLSIFLLIFFHFWWEIRCFAFIQMSPTVWKGKLSPLNHMMSTRTIIINVDIFVDSAQTEYCSTFHCPCVSRRDISTFLNYLMHIIQADHPDHSYDLTTWPPDHDD